MLVNNKYTETVLDYGQIRCDYTLTIERENASSFLCNSEADASELQKNKEV